jgi:hypothetical protein
MGKGSYSLEHNFGVGEEYPTPVKKIKSIISEKD